MLLNKATLDREDQSPYVTRRLYSQAGDSLLKNGPFLASYKMPEFFEQSPLSEAKKHPDFQVTSCHHFDTTNVDFAYIESE